MNTQVVVGFAKKMLVVLIALAVINTIVKRVPVIGPVVARVRDGL